MSNRLKNGGQVSSYHIIGMERQESYRLSTSNGHITTINTRTAIVFFNALALDGETDQK
jgi:hypothetical protein